MRARPCPSITTSVVCRGRLLKRSALESSLSCLAVSAAASAARMAASATSFPLGVSGVNADAPPGCTGRSIIVGSIGSARPGADVDAVGDAAELVGRLVRVVGVLALGRDTAGPHLLIFPVAVLIDVADEEGITRAELADHIPLTVIRAREVTVERPGVFGGTVDDLGGGVAVILAGGAVPRLGC